MTSLMFATLVHVQGSHASKDHEDTNDCKLPTLPAAPKSCCSFFSHLHSCAGSHWKEHQETQQTSFYSAMFYTVEVHHENLVLHTSKTAAAQWSSNKLATACCRCYS